MGLFLCQSNPLGVVPVGLFIIFPYWKDLGVSLGMLDSVSLRNVGFCVSLGTMDFVSLGNVDFRLND